MKTLMMNTVILPVKNEPRIAEFIASLNEPLNSLGDVFEVIVVTGDRETQHNPIPRFDDVVHYVSYGDSLERAILLGFSVANGDKVVVMDVDGSHPVEALVDMFGALDDVDFVVGSRFMDGSVFDQSFTRKLVSYFFISVARLCGSRISDPMSGFFGFKRSLLDGVRFMPITWKTCLELELKTRPSYKEVPICFGKRVSGVSKTNFRIGLYLLRDLLKLMAGYG